MGKSSNTAKRPPRAGDFKKGDPRINRNGQISKKRLEFNKTLRDLLIEEGEKETIAEDKAGNVVKKKKVEFLVMSVWKKAIEGESWAVNFIAERVEGKITQPVDMEGNISLEIKRTITDERPKE